jgi:hypothetical protein
LEYGALPTTGRIDVTDVGRRWLGEGGGREGKQAQQSRQGRSTVKRKEKPNQS